MTAAADLRQVVNSLQRQFSRPLSKRELREVGDLSAEAIFRRTKKGFGVKDTGGNKRKLRSLSEQYIKFRRGFSSLARDTSPRKSNLTLTGQMLASIGTTKVRQGTNGKALVLVAPKGRKNINKALWQADQGRIFMNLSKKELREIKEFMSKSIKSNVRKR